MAEVNITRLSTKGQVVIPLEMRKGLKEGYKLLVIKNEETIILRKAGSLEKKFVKDFENAKKIKASIEKHEKTEVKKEEEFKYPSYLR